MPIKYPFHSKKTKEEEVKQINMKTKNKNPFVGLAPRKQRRAEARQNNIKFQPQYNGEAPMRVQHEDVLKSQINEEKRNTKRAQKKVL